MTHIPDLAAYDYHRGAPRALAVGWPDSSVPFATGRCPDDVCRRLAELADHPVRLMRGYHFCQFCRSLNATDDPQALLDVPHGNGEVWITAPDGTRFAAPALIAHYVDAHEYLPPGTFVDAVRHGRPSIGVS